MIKTTYKLGEVCSRLSSGKNIKATDIANVGDYPVYGGNGVRGFTNKYNFDGECSIIGRQGAYCGNVQLFKGKAYMTEHAVIVCGNERANSHYLGYVLSVMDLGRLSHQAAQPGLSVKVLSEQEIELPTKENQDKIVEIILGYDNLIENNQKQIKLLEEAAQRLYKEWFVDLRFPGYENTPIIDGVPEGWTKPAMNDIAEYLNGFAFKPDDWGEKGKPIIKIKEMNEGITSSTPRNDGSRVPEKYNISAGDILFSWSATLTAMIWDSESGLLNQHLFKVTPNEGIGREYVLQSILKTLDEFKNLTTGSTMKHIQRGKLKEVFVNMPSSDIMNKYVLLSEPIREKILILKKQNNSLKEARDRLLPKLMSGEIEV